MVAVVVAAVAVAVAAAVAAAAVAVRWVTVPTEVGWVTAVAGRCDEVMIIR